MPCHLPYADGSDNDRLTDCKVDNARARHAACATLDEDGVVEASVDNQCFTHRQANCDGIHCGMPTGKIAGLSGE